MARHKPVLSLCFGIIACFAFCVVGCVGQPQGPATSPLEDSVKRFLQDYLRTAGFGDDHTTRYYASFVSLSDRGKQDVVVYLTGRSWCGSGGCTTLILAPKGSSYRVVTRITISRPPIRVLATRSNGWHDISVQVQGGGIQPGYEVQLPFDGKTYPRNPSTPRARRLTEKVSGEVLVPPTSEGKPLYR
jgi:hypothetical protein